jgi:hypothetical protein
MHLLTQLKAQHRAIAVAIALAQDFCALVRERQADRFEPLAGAGRNE